MRRPVPLWSVGVALVAVLTAAALPRAVAAAQTESRYNFTPVAFIGGQAPGGEDGKFSFDFETGSVNERGQVAFVADVSTGGEGVFTGVPGHISQLFRSGEPAPGGGTFGGFGAFGYASLNDDSDVAATFGTEPYTAPLGRGAGVYHFSHRTKTVAAVVVPGVTPAPGGGVFAGAGFHASLNDRGDIAFTGMVPATIGPGAAGGLGLGVFKALSGGHVASVARPGTSAPGGGVFDFAQNPWVNARGDVAFGGHIAGEECINLGNGFPDFIFCAESVYVRTEHGIHSIAHQGAPAPGGGTYRFAFGPVLNNRGQVLFVGDLTPPAVPPGRDLAVFLNTDSKTISVARPGDRMPGGGLLRAASFFIENYHLNNRGEVAFNATLDTDINHDGVPDAGLYVLSHDSLHLVARTGTVIPGLGTIAFLDAPGLAGQLRGGAIISDRGKVLFSATLADGRGILLTASPG